MSITRRTAVASLLGLLAAFAQAGGRQPFTQEAFDRLTRAGKPVVLDVTAPWCPTCKAQKPVIDALLKEPAYRDVTLLNIDFDTDKATLKRFDVTVQATLIGFKGTQEVGYRIGDTSREALESLFKATVQ